MSILKKLFGGGSNDNTSSGPQIVAEETYEGFHIAAAPVPEGGQFRLAATISKEIAGETKTHDLIRADMFTSADEAASFAIRKAKQVIDERGEDLFAG